MSRTAQLTFGILLTILGAALVYQDGIWLDETGGAGGDPVRLSLWLWPLVGIVITVTGALRTPKRHPHVRLGERQQALSEGEHVRVLDPTLEADAEPAHQASDQR